MIRRAPLLLAALLVACDPTSLRPAFSPVPEAQKVETRFRIVPATDRLAKALQDHDIPLTTIALRDGYVESPWIDTTTMSATTARPLGEGVVRVRGWVTPGQLGYSFLTVEVVYRKVVDPSLPGRELDVPVPDSHPVRKRVAEALEGLKSKRTATPPVPAPAAAD